MNEMLKDYLQGKRNMKKRVYSMLFTLYRAIQNNRISWDEGIEILENLKKERK